MLNRLGEIYVTLAPAILAGVLNMIWVRLPWALSLAIPMDRGIIRSDGYRLLGDHKTWKGFLGMIGLGALSALFWGGLPHHMDDASTDPIYAGAHLPLVHFFRLRLPGEVQRRLRRDIRSG